MSLPYIYYKNRPKKLTTTFVVKEYKKLIRDIKSAENSNSPDLWIELYRQWNALEAYIIGECSRVHYEYARDVGNKVNESKELYFSQNLLPAIEELENKLTVALYESKHKNAIGKKFGKRLLINNAITAEQFDPRNIEIGKKQSKLKNSHSKITNSAMTTIDGKKMTLFSTRKLAGSPSSEDRKKAYLARADWVEKNGHKIETIFAKLIPLRIKSASNAGFDNYADYRYKSLGRTDFTKIDAEAFRESVKKYLVPLRIQLAEKLLKSLNQKDIKPWDIAYNSPFYSPELHIPDDVLSIDDQLSKSQEVFKRLSPKLSKHFAFMVKNELIDLEERPSKMKPGFCTHFTDQGVVAILCNSVGSAEDVTTITHEMGHAFQGMESAHIESIDMQSPTLELCEIHSMGMEFLTLPVIDTYFGKEYSKSFEINHWWEAIDTIVYVAAIDELQHWIYDNPTSKPDDWHKKWYELLEKYLPGANDKGYQKFQSKRWIMQSHVIRSPFYFLDYGLAQICAMQLGMIDAKDHKKAMSIYFKLCKIGGTKSFLEALKYAGLDSPFDERAIKNTANFAAKKLGITPVR